MEDRSDNIAVPDTEHNNIVTLHTSNFVNDTDVDYKTSNSNSNVNCRSNSSIDSKSDTGVDYDSNSDIDVNILFSSPHDQTSNNELNILMLHCCGNETVELSWILRFG